MPARAVADPAGGGVEDDDTDRRGAGAGDVRREGVEGGQGGGDVCAREDLLAQHRAELPHHGGGLDAVPDDVPGDEREFAVRKGQRVEPVAAGGRVLGGDQVGGRHLGPRHDRDGRRQQCLLHHSHRVAGLLVLLRHQLGPCLGAAPGQDTVGHVGGEEEQPGDAAVGVAAGAMVKSK